MDNRIQTADLLKGIAVLLMIQVHIVELLGSNEIFKSSIGGILLFLGGPPVAPVFSIILGYFLVFSKKSAKQLIIRGIKIICLGMFLNIALNLNLIISVSKGIYKIELLPYIFGVDILQFAGMAIIIIAVLKKVLEKSLLFVIVCIVISACLGNYLVDYIPENKILKYVSAFFYGSCEWAYFPLFPWLSYPFAGVLFYQIKKRFDFSFLNKPKLKLLLGIVFLLFFVFTINYAISVSSKLQAYYHHQIMFFLWMILFLVFYSFFINEVNKFFGDIIIIKYLKWLGKNVTVIYVIQWIIIGNTATEIFKSIASPLYLLMIFLIILFFSSGIGYFILWVKNRFIKGVTLN